FLPQYFFSWCPETKPYSHKELPQEGKIETSEFTVPRCYCRRIDSYQHFIVLGSRFLYLFELKNFRRPIFCAYNRSHLGIPNQACLLTERLKESLKRFFGNSLS